MLCMGKRLKFLGGLFCLNCYRVRSCDIKTLRTFRNCLNNLVKQKIGSSLPELRAECSLKTNSFNGSCDAGLVG